MKRPVDVAHHSWDLTARIWPILVGYCRRFGQHAGDIAAEAFLQIYSNDRNGKKIPHENVEGYAVVVATRKWIDYCRRERNVCQLESEARHLAVEPDHSLDPQELLQLLKALPRQQQVCLGLFYQHGYSYKEISDRTGLPVNEVKSHLQNGVKRLRKLVRGGDVE